MKNRLNLIRLQKRKRLQSNTTHVEAVGWEPHGSSPTTCTGKADHGLVNVCPLL